MNELIEKYFNQTLDDKFKETWTSLGYEDLQKFTKYFAELIVLDLADYIAKNQELSLEQSYTLAKDIKKRYEIKI